jgi:type II secretory pathway component PulM
MGLSDVPADQLLAWVQASTQAQGLPLKVADPATVERVRALLTGGEPRPARARGAGARDSADSS